MSEILSDIRTFMHDRFGSPFWLSTIASWILLNWPLVITALFEPEIFNASYVDAYFMVQSVHRYITWPILFGLGYSIFSGVLKETVEGLAKTFRSLTAKLFSKFGLYESISVETYNRELTILKRKIARNNLEKDEIDSIKKENEYLISTTTRLEEERSEAERLISEHINSNGNNTTQAFVKSMGRMNFSIPLESRVKNDEPKESEADDIRSENLKILDEEFQKNLHAESNAEGTSVGTTMRIIREELIDDPSSHDAIFLTLLLFSSPSAYSDSPDPELIGLKNDVFLQALETCIKSGFIKKKDKAHALTPDGKGQINKYINSSEMETIAMLLIRSEDIVIEEIRNALSLRTLSIQELGREVTYHPFLKDIVAKLINQKEITSRNGKLYKS